MTLKPRLHLHTTEHTPAGLYIASQVALAQKAQNEKKKSKPGCAFGDNYNLTALSIKFG